MIEGLGLDRFPELRADYFRGYKRIVYLAQSDDAELTALAESAAERLGLAFERRYTGLTRLADFLGKTRPAKGDACRSASPSLSSAGTVRADGGQGAASELSG